MRTLDEILAAAGVSAEKQSLVARWNAGIAEPKPPQPDVEVRPPAVTPPPPSPAGSLDDRRRTALILGAVLIGLAAIFALYFLTRMSAADFATRGDRERQAGSLDRALEDYGEAIRRYAARNAYDANLVALHCSRGDILRTRAAYGEASSDYSAALRIDASATCAMFGRAEGFLAQGEWQRAVADYAAGVRLAPDRAMTWIERGETLQRADDFAAALRVLRGGVGAFRELVRTEPRNTVWQRDLGVAYYKTAFVLRQTGQLSEAFETFRDSLSIVQRLIANNRADPQLQGDLQQLVKGFGGLSYRLVLKKEFSRALDAANQATWLAPGEIWLYTNQAHALMFLGRTDAARSIYLKYRGAKDVSGGDGWEITVLKDFDEMAEAGLSHPLMYEIRHRFDGSR